MIKIMNNEVPTISVLMPVYNAEKYLAKAIESILNQSFRDFEFIIINDGSTDESEKIIKSFTDERIVYIKNEVNLKLIKTLNKGIDVARGKYIARMDADDICVLDRFEKQLDIFRSYNGVDIVNSKIYVMDSHGIKYSENKSAIPVNFEAAKYLAFLRNMIIHPVVMVKTDLMKEYRYRDDSYFEHIEDYELWLRMFRSGCICYTIEESLLYYRFHAASINRTQASIQHERMFFLCKSALLEDIGYKFDDEVLWNLLGESKNYNYSLLVKTKNELFRYVSYVSNKFPLSERGVEDMLLWSKHRIFAICGRFFSKGNSLNKLGVILFLLLNSGWGFDMKWLKKLRELLLPPKDVCDAQAK